LSKIFGSGSDSDTIEIFRSGSDYQISISAQHCFTRWQQATIEIILAISLTIAYSRYTYNGVIFHAHPVRGESQNQRNATRDVATTLITQLCSTRTQRYI